MAKAKLPISRAKTAYGLLSEIAALALDEPKRMSMAIWHERETDDPMDTPKRGFPKCGTVGCIGGWTETIAPRRHGERPSAESVLGITQAQEDELFYADDLCTAPNQQTVGHAKAVARHIRKFQKKYRHQLLAKKV